MQPLYTFKYMIHNFRICRFISLNGVSLYLVSSNVWRIPTDTKVLLALPLLNFILLQCFSGADFCCCYQIALFALFSALLSSDALRFPWFYASTLFDIVLIFTSMMSCKFVICRLCVCVCVLKATELICKHFFLNCDTMSVWCVWIQWIMLQVLEFSHFLR